ncbi:putative N-acetylmuramoyl-L-alanine amidase [Laribacter hongkongensis HLHK9]|uniref:Putative N-acetylmuramoyl-L-alanine amidase n=1 Tax=Laribacter hongkongensis (strain HLHK9) TaxID=557598 RepID=C1D6P2_LARHH|nr:N-acetylmuramoyl-L-alanine amidase [Laribacter hongkongensis]ACO74149.1 putative N-acetylmuramoyl-L-alanine amidase [Laribacter hongkongensis HLHK9]
MTRPIDLIVIHCAATPDGVRLARGTQPATAVIDGWHASRGFHRSEAARRAFNPALAAIGYHFVIDCDGTLDSGRAEDETGAHAAGHNARSLGICLAGTGRFTPAQWQSLSTLVRSLRARHPAARLCGHRDLSPDRNGDGVVSPAEWTKTCPGFSVADWLAAGMRPAATAVTE